MEEKIRNLTFIVILGFVITFMLIIGLYFRDGGSNSNTTTKNNSGGSQSSSSEYDVSAMNEVSLDEAVDLFDEKGTHVLYIGRADCSVCIQFVPVLNEVQEDLGFTTYYLDVYDYINDWKNTRDELKPLTELLTTETTVRTTINSENVTLEDTVGNLFYDYGFTPITVIIKDGKMVDGFIGYRDKDSLTELIEENL